jgi:hypothetical protein
MYYIHTHISAMYPNIIIDKSTNKRRITGPIEGIQIVTINHTSIEIEFINPPESPKRSVS